MLLIFFSVIAGLLLIPVIFIIVKSPGKPEPFLNSEGKPFYGSLSEKTFVKIGSVKQGMFIRSKNIQNPVLLYVHGGPAFPNYFLIEKYKPQLEDFFTVCYWEQRGGGLSFSPEVDLGSMNFDQLTLDAVEVSNYLRRRFNKEKIYIIAHSGGTPIALMAVKKAPELYSAYLAVAQITNQKESEKIAFRYMVEKYSEKANKKALNELKQFNVLSSGTNIETFYKSVTRDKSMHQLGIGTMHQMNSIFWDIFVPVWTCKAYTLNEKMKIWKSKFTFLPKTNLVNELLNRDFSREIDRIEIPVYFFCGEYDFTVNSDLSKAYFKKLQAPLKGFYTFSNSAHSPLFEEPEKFRKILREDVLNGTINYADN